MSAVYDTDILVWSEDQAMYGEPRPPLPAACPWSLDELLGSESDGS
jgi:hypothetical protein